MNKNHLSSMIMGAMLIVVTLIAAQAFRSPFSVEKISRPSVGMGDLRLFEAQQSIPVTGSQEISRPSVGMGDLRHFEAQQSIPVTGAQASSHPSVGMGDLRLFEAQQKFLSK